MPKFEIEQFELHVQTYAVEATSEAEAIEKLLDGEAVPIDEALDFVEVADERGLLVAENPKLASALRVLGVEVERVIPSIRSIKQVE